MNLELIDKVGWQIATFITGISTLVWIIRTTNTRMDEQHREHREDRKVWRTEDKTIQREHISEMRGIGDSFRKALKEVSEEARDGHEKVSKQLNNIEDYSRRTYSHVTELIDTTTKEHDRIINKVKK